MNFFSYSRIRFAVYGSGRLGIVREKSNICGLT